VFLNKRFKMISLKNNRQVLDNIIKRPPNDSVSCKLDKKREYK